LPDGETLSHLAAWLKVPLISLLSEDVGGKETPAPPESLSERGIDRPLLETKQGGGDLLSGLFDKEYMLKTLTLEIQRGEPFSLLLIAIDHFKLFTLQFGEQAGAALLQEFGAFLQRNAAKGELACRYDVDDFALICPGDLLDQAQQRAEALRKNVKSLGVEHKGRPLGRVTISVGIALFPDHGPTREDVFLAADAALEQAKRDRGDEEVLACKKFLRVSEGLDSPFPPPPIRPKCTLLVVDDEPHVLATLSALLIKDFEILTAASAEAAQGLFADRSIDLVLADQKMPRVTGVELLKWVGKHHPKTERLLMTGYPAVEDAIEAINESHIFSYVLKPFGKGGTLLETLRKAARHYLLERSHEHFRNELLEEKAALTDPLTGLPNRVAMERVGRRELHRRERYPSSLALGLIDIDQFKDINNRYMLPGGDKVLLDLAKVLIHSLRPKDFLGRVGNDDFLLVAPETDLEGCKVLGETLRAVVEKTEFSYRGQIIPVRISLGFCVAEENVPADYEQMKHLAGESLSQAKQTGKNRCAFSIAGLAASRPEPVAPK
jgi:diguanylate cyclase (GGDEF)-like protein